MIDELREKFKAGKILPTDWLGDSLSRFELFKEWGSKVDTICECGVYTGHSTLAFLASKPKKLISVDITDQYITILPELTQIAKDLNVNYEFRVADSLKTNVHVDLLFIDTYHSNKDPIGTYKHTLKELVWHYKDVSKYIMLHDTTSHPDVRRAVVDFNLVYNWKIVYEDTDGDGTMVISK
jgi:hypothetical protein